MRHRRDLLPKKYPRHFHECSFCHSVGLKPGILDTKHGDYGMRNIFQDEQELKLDKMGLCDECAKQLETGI